RLDPRAAPPGCRDRLPPLVRASRQYAGDRARRGGAGTGCDSRSQLHRMPRVSFPKPYADIVAKLRVPCGFALAAAFLWLSQPTFLSLAAGLPVSILGLGLRAWAAGHLEKNTTLTESGPYAWVRNPLYIGTLTAAAGFV